MVDDGISAENWTEIGVIGVLKIGISKDYVEGSPWFWLELKWARVARLTTEMLAATFGNAVNAVSSKGGGVYPSLGVSTSFGVYTSCESDWFDGASKAMIVAARHLGR